MLILDFFFPGVEPSVIDGGIREHIVANKKQWNGVRKGGFPLFQYDA